MSLSPASPRKRILSIQVCRGLAALFVVFAHLSNVETKYFSTRFLAWLHYGDGGVDLFFVISGVVISAVTLNKFQSSRNALTFLYHRFARVYPIYWIYSVLVFGAFLYDPHWVNATSGSHPQILRSFLLIPSFRPLLVMQGWTLTYEVYFYLVFFCLLLLCPERFAPWALAVWAAAVLLFDFTGPPPSGPIIATITSPLILEFLAGCLLFQLYRKSRLHPAVGIVLLLASPLWLALVFHVAALHGTTPLLDTVLRPVLFGPFALLFVGGAMELERTGIIRYARPLVAIGDWSYSLYLSHIIVVESFGRLFFYVLPPMHLAIIPVAVLALAASLLVGYLSYTYLELPITSFLYKPSRPPVSLRTSHS